MRIGRVAFLLVAALLAIRAAWQVLPPIESQLTRRQRGAGELPGLEDLRGGDVVLKVPDDSGGPGDVAIVEFADYECPYCAQYSRDTLPRVRREWVASAGVRYITLALPLTRNHPNAYRSARAAACARRQERYWAMRDSLFTRHPTVDSDYLSLAASAGLDLRAFEICFANGALPELDYYIGEAHRLGITATPTFLVGYLTNNDRFIGSFKITGAQPLQVFDKAIRTVRSARTSD
jgi:protein-disulfide isomerase